MKLIPLIAYLKDLKKRLKSMAKAVKNETIMINGASSNIQRKSQGTRR